MSQIGDVTQLELSQSLAHLEQAIEQWEDDQDAPQTTIGGEPRKMITEYITGLWDELALLVNTDRVEVIVQPLVILIDDFFGVYYDWKRDVSARENATDPGGSVELWQAWQNVIKWRPRRSGRKPEPITILQAQKVPERQIALIYEFITPSGEPDTTRIRREMADPGSEYDPETWESSSDRQARVRTADTWENRDRSPYANIHAPRRPVSRDELIAPESMSDLLAAGVPFKQIALMKQITEDEVRQFANALGISSTQAQRPPADPRMKAEAMMNEMEQRAKAVEDARRAIEKSGLTPTETPDYEAEDAAAVADQAINTYAELDNPMEQIRQMAFDGVSADNIYEGLKSQHKVTKRTIRDAVRQAKNDAELTG